MAMSFGFDVFGAFFCRINELLFLRVDMHCVFGSMTFDHFKVWFL